MGKLKNSICIVNPVSGNRRWERDKVIREGLEFYVGNIELTNSKGHGMDLAREAAEKYDYVIAVGGDGTILDIVNGMMGSEHMPVLGIVPLGTGNCFVDNLGISKNVKKACANLVKGKPKEIDLTEILAVRGTSSFVMAQRVFSQVASVGLDAEILHMRDESGVPGLKGYVTPTLKTAKGFKPQYKKITLKDGFWFGGPFGEKVIELNNNIQTVVSKGKYYGFKFKMSPKAVMDDGYLDIMMFNMSKGKMLLDFHKIYRGKRVEGAVHFKAKEAFVEGSQLPTQHDGEFLGDYEHIGFSVKEKALKVIVPYPV